MAYFANSTEGETLDVQCDQCIHEDPDAGCPIALVQMEYCYSQIGNKLLEECLNMLINEKGICQMKPVIEKYCQEKKDLRQRELFK